jgi:anti-anti-sigma factor
MNISVRTHDDLTILEPSGKITLGDGDQDLAEAVRTHLEQGARNIIINFSHVSYLDSSGIGELVGSYTSILNRGGQLKLCAMNTRTFSLIKLTSLHSVFDVLDSEAEAIQAFHAAAPR